MSTTMTARSGSSGERPGTRTYHIAAVAAYRRAMGVSQTEVAKRVQASQAYISMVERSRDEIIQETTVAQILDAIDGIATDRARLAREGLERANPADEPERAGAGS